MTLAPGGAPVTIAEGVRGYANATPGAIAVIDGDRTLTFAALNERASRLANVLLGAGLEQGQRVAVLLGNRLEYPEVACGIAKAGLVMVPLNPRLTATEIGFIMGHSGCRALVLDNALADAASAAVAELGIDLVVGIDGDGLGQSYETVLGNASALDPPVGIDELAPFCIAYTSGTTGDPKGVVISHRSRSLTFYCSALEWGLANGRTSIAVAPMYHGAGFAFGYAPVYTGGTVVMLRKWDRRCGAWCNGTGRGRFYRPDARSDPPRAWRERLCRPRSAESGHCSSMPPRCRGRSNSGSWRPFRTRVCTSCTARPPAS
jgi:long-chain acyl-CoA synthetase